MMSLSLPIGLTSKRNGAVRDDVASEAPAKVDERCIWALICRRSTSLNVRFRDHPKLQLMTDLGRFRLLQVLKLTRKQLFGGTFSGYPAARYKGSYLFSRGSNRI